MFGGKNDEIVLTVDIICSNATIKSEKAVTLEMTASGTANITMADLMIYPNITSLSVQNVTKTFDKVPMYYHDYTMLFQQLVQNTIFDINLKYQKGMSISKLLPNVDLSELREIYMSPYLNDHWLYAGFSVVQDGEVGLIEEGEVGLI